MSTPENKTKARIKKVLDAHDCAYRMPVPAGFGKPTLDFYGARPSDGHAFAIEAKKHRGEPNAQQWKTIAEFRDGNWKVFVIDDEADGLALKHESCHALDAWLSEKKL